MGVENLYLKLSVQYQYGDDVKHRRIQEGKIQNSVGVANDFFERGKFLMRERFSCCSVIFNTHLRNIQKYASF